MRGVVERLAAPMGYRHLAEDLITKAVLAVLWHLHFLLDRAQQLFVRRYLLTRDGISEFGLIKIGLDIVQVVIDQRPGLLLERDKKRFLHVGTGDLVILLAR